MCTWKVSNTEISHQTEIFSLHFVNEPTCRHRSLGLYCRWRMKATTQMWAFSRRLFVKKIKTFLENGSASDGLCFLYKQQNYLQDRQCTNNVNIEARPRNHCCRRKATGIIYREFVSVTVANQHAKRTGHIATCALSGSTVFFHLISWTTRFPEKKVIEHKKCFDFVCFLLGNSPASGVYVPTFRNTLSVPSL